MTTAVERDCLWWCPRYGGIEQECNTHASSGLCSDCLTGLCLRETREQVERLRAELSAANERIEELSYELLETENRLDSASKA